MTAALERELQRGRLGSDRNPRVRVVSLFACPRFEPSIADECCRVQGWSTLGHVVIERVRKQLSAKAYFATEFRGYGRIRVVRDSAKSIMPIFLLSI